MQMSQAEPHEWSCYKKAPFLILCFSLCIIRGLLGFVLQGVKVKILAQEIIEEMALAANR